MRDAERKAGEEQITGAIVAHVREALPPSASKSVNGEPAGRVRIFVRIVLGYSYYPVDTAKLQDAAIAAIDAANGPTATADSLVHAAIEGAAKTLTDSDTGCTHCRDTPRRSGPPTSVQVGTIRVISFPDLYLPEAVSQPCSALDHYVDFPTDGVTGVVLDLRGNQGGPLPVAICLAGEFLQPGTPLFQLTDRSHVEMQKSPKLGKNRPLTLPLVIFMDEDTESGALALAASLRDAGRASLIGESKEKANGTIRNLIPTTWSGKDQFLLPIGYISRVGGAPLANGLQVDVVVSPQSESALMDAAKARLMQR
jgi:hypothetical protein